MTLPWKSADLLEAVVPIAGSETVLNTVEISGHQPVSLPPVCLPYSPEFAPDQPGRGPAALAQIAASTGGRELVEIPRIWKDLPVHSRCLELTPWLFSLALISFLVEILERRTGWVLRRFGRKLAPASVQAKVTGEAKSAPTAVAPPAVGERRVLPGPIKPAEAKPASSKAPGAESTLSALREARERANRRTG